MMRRKLLTALIFTLSLVWLLLPLAVAHGATYYVAINDPNADDDNLGTEEALPWKTLTKAANTAQAGDTVLVKAGIYNETLRPANSGAPGAMITFKAYPGQECQGEPGERKSNCQVVIDGTGLNDHGIYLGTNSYIRIEGFEIRNSGLSGIMGHDDFYAASSGGNWEIVNNYVHHNGGGHFAGEGNVGDSPLDGAGFVTCNTNKVLIENNEFYANADAGIRFWGNNHGNSNVIIRGNNIHYNSLDGIEVGNANSQTLVENFIVEDNVLYDSFDTDLHQDAINFYGGSNITIRNNIAYDFTQLIYFPVKDITDGTGLLEDVDIYGNILYTERYWTEWGGEWSKGIFIDARRSDNVVRNINIHSNTIGWVGFGYWAVSIIGITGIVVDNITLRNNLFYESGATIHNGATNVDSDYNLYHNVDSFFITSFEGPNSFINTVNPQFVYYYSPKNPEYISSHGDWDFHLQPTSPAIDKGDPNLANLFTLPDPFLDLDGNRRFYGMGYDIGAYEYTLLPRVVISAEPDKGYVPLTVVFTISEIELPNGNIVTYEWDFGDGATSQEKEPSHIYTSPGEYTVTLTVTDIQGYKGRARTHIVVLEKEKEFEELSIGCYNNVINPLKREKAIIIVEIEEQGYIKIDLYDIKGNKIKELEDEEKEPDIYKYYWDGKNDSGNVVGSGLYFVHIQAGDYKKTKKIVVVK